MHILQGFLLKKKLSYFSEEPSANPWVQLMDKIIRCHGDGESVIDMLKQLCRTTSLNVEVQL